MKDERLQQWIKENTPLHQAELDDIDMFKGAMVDKLTSRTVVHRPGSVFGDKWSRREWINPDFIPIDRIYEEVGELLFDATTDKRRMEELVDIANFCMMAWNNLRRKEADPNA